MKILLFGGTGQIGAELLRRGDPDIAWIAPGRAAADLAEPAACAALVRAERPDVVVNAAAYTAVDRAETEEPLATLVNGVAPGAIARAAAETGAAMLHVSTDYVFDGAAAVPPDEDAPVAPLNAYGRGKLAGERAVAAAGGRAVVLRTAWVFSAHGANFVKTMLRLGRERERLSVVDDQRGGPTPAADAAAALVTLARRLRDGDAGGDAGGVLHYCGAPTVSWRAFAEAIFARADWARRPEVAPIAAADWPTPARRPAFSALDCSRIAARHGIAQPDWRPGLDRVLAELGERAA